MAATPWWWAPLITVIGTPLLGALLYFFVPLLRVAKYWLTREPYWWVSQILVALLVGGAILYSGKHIDDLRATRERVAAEHQHDLDRDIAASQARHAERLENLRFVRQLSTQTGIPRPFSELDLQDQNLARLDLTGAHLDGAKLQHANLNLADLRSTPTQATNLVDATLTGATLTGANLTGADLRYADLTGANLTGANLTGATLRVANLTGADLLGATLRYADLTGANLTGADLLSATLRYADLTGANLTGADLTNADLTGATLKDANYDENTAWPEGFKAPRCGHQALCVLQ